MNRHLVMRLSLWVACLMLLIPAGCGTKGKYADLSWEDTLNEGKRITNDTSLPSNERFAAAEATYRIALKKLQVALKKETVKTSEMRELFNELESVLRTQGKVVEVEQVLKTKVSLYTEYIGKERVLTGAAHEALGNSYRKSGRNQMAEGEYTDAMRIYKANNRTSAVTKMQTRIDDLKVSGSGTETSD